MDPETHIWRINPSDTTEYLVSIIHVYPHSNQSSVLLHAYRCTDLCRLNHVHQARIQWDARNDQYDARNDALTPINNSVEILLEVT